LKELLWICLVKMHAWDLTLTFTINSGINKIYFTFLLKLLLRYAWFLHFVLHKTVEFPHNKPIERDLKFNKKMDILKINWRVHAREDALFTQQFV